MSYAGYALISTILDVPLDLPVEIVQGVRLQKASEAQIERIRDYLPKEGLVRATGRFESERVPAPGGIGITWAPLPREKWRYFVLDYEDRTDALRDVGEVLSVGEKSLHFSLVFLEKVTPEGRKPYGMMSGPNDDWQREFFFPEPVVIDAEAVADFREAFCCRVALDPVRHEGIARALALYARIASRQSSEFRVLEFFAVIEMLLTHQPGNREIGDSIRHQLQTKIPLLEARMPAPLDYREFDGLQPKKVWEHLYSYRSAVAHGGHVDFGKSLKGLVSQTVSGEFLQEATRKLLRQALREPDLVTSLKSV